MEAIEFLRKKYNVPQSKMLQEILEQPDFNWQVIMDLLNEYADIFKKGQDGSGQFETIVSPLTYNVQEDGLRIRVCINNERTGELHLTMKHTRSISDWYQMFEKRILPKKSG